MRRLTLALQLIPSDQAEDSMRGGHLIEGIGFAGGVCFVGFFMTFVGFGMRRPKDHDDDKQCWHQS